MRTIYDAMNEAEGVLFRFQKTGDYHNYPCGTSREVLINGVRMRRTIQMSRHPEHPLEVEGDFVAVDLEFLDYRECAAEWVMWVDENGIWDAAMFRYTDEREAWQLDEEDKIDDMINQAVADRNGEILAKEAEK